MGARPFGACFEYSSYSATAAAAVVVSRGKVSRGHNWVVAVGLRVPRASARQGSQILQPFGVLSVEVRCSHVSAYLSDKTNG